MVRVTWSRGALFNLRFIIETIARHDEAAARRFSERLLALGGSLDTFPHRGRPALHGSRELVGAPPYILRYQGIGDQVLILEIRHGRQRPGA